MYYVLLRELTSCGLQGKLRHVGQPSQDKQFDVGDDGSRRPPMVEVQKTFADDDEAEAGDTCVPRCGPGRSKQIKQ